MKLTTENQSNTKKNKKQNKKKQKQKQKTKTKTKLLTCWLYIQLKNTVVFDVMEIFTEQLIIDGGIPDIYRYNSEHRELYSNMGMRIEYTIFLMIRLTIACLNLLDIETEKD